MVHIDDDGDNDDEDEDDDNYDDDDEDGDEEDDADNYLFGGGETQEGSRAHCCVHSQADLKHCHYESLVIIIITI